MRQVLIELVGFHRLDGLRVIISMDSQCYYVPAGERRPAALYKSLVGKEPTQEDLEECRAYKLRFEKTNRTNGGALVYEFKDFERL